MPIAHTYNGLFLLLGFTATGLAWLGSPHQLAYWMAEDGPIENASAGLYLAGLVFSVIAAFHRERRPMALVWTLLCLLFAGEETSWGQRLFHYSVPAVENANAQGEFNLHNLTVFSGGSLVNESFSFRHFLKAQNLFRLGFFGYFLVIPVLVTLGPVARVATRLGYRKPGAGFAIALVAVFLPSFALAIPAEPMVKHALAETREMLCALAILIHIVTCVRPTS